MYHRYHRVAMAVHDDVKSNIKAHKVNSIESPRIGDKFELANMRIDVIGVNANDVTVHNGDHAWYINLITWKQMVADKKILKWKKP